MVLISVKREERQHVTRARRLLLFLIVAAVLSVSIVKYSNNNNDESASWSQSADVRPRRYGDPHIKAQPFPHPHAGARDELGRWGYVHDPTILARKPRPFVVLPEERDGVCAELGRGPIEVDDPTTAKRLFRDQIRVAEPNETSSKTSSSASSSVKVFCAVYSYPGNKNQTDAIASTWGGRCDGYMTASTETNHDLAIVDLPHFGEWEGKYEGIWQKVRSMISYAYDNFLDDYDFYFICGDDTYLIMENLKEFLTSPKFVENSGGNEYPNIVYTGEFVHPTWFEKEYGKSFYYMGGGSGYVLSRTAVRALVEHVFPVCNTDTDTSEEDMLIGLCLVNVLNVAGYDSRDEQGRERFFGIGPIDRALVDPDPKKMNIKKYLLDQFRWRRDHLGWGEALLGVNSISPKAISFHLMTTPAKMKRLERLLYRMSPTHIDQDCNGNNTSNTN